MNVELRSVSIADQTVRLGKSERVHFISDSRLERCRIEVRTSGRQIIIVRSVFVDCTIVAHSKLTALQFHGAKFEGCTFEGTFRNCDFGARHDEESWEFGGVKRCSFVDATLDKCAFFAGVDGARWPGWPHIVVIDPLARLEDWTSAAFPPAAGLDLSYIDDPEWPAGRLLHAFAFHLPSLGKAIDPEAIWPLVQDRPYVMFDGKESKARATASEVASLRDANEIEIATHRRRGDALKKWNLLCFATLDALTSTASGLCTLTFDTRFLRKRVTDAPARVAVTFRCDADALSTLRGKIDALGTRKFIVRAVDALADGLVMRGQRKTYGTIDVPTLEAAFEDPERPEATLERLSECVRRYWSGD